ncbi:hypothetical protein ACIBBB_10415 [Streptomyces sp. NPDC051217]
MGGPGLSAGPAGTRGNRDEIVVATKAGARPAGPGGWPANAEELDLAG